jgi:hypothetical protein
MKSDSNTEMDSLLRRHARREGVPVYGAGDTPGASSTGRTSVGPHLDADEMNAYTEGKLPAPVRARYVSHLADCDQCRRIVTALALAANIPHEDQEREARQGALTKSSWREWLAALFAPPMIRYGAGALVLLCVAGVVFVAMRQQQASRQKEEPALVARNDERKAESASAVRTEPGQQPSPLTPASPVVPGGEASPAQDAKAKRPATETGADTVAEQANGPTTKETARADAPLSATEPSLARDPAQQRTARDEDLAMAKSVPSASPPAEVSPSTSRANERSEVDEMTQSRKDEGMSDDRQAATGIVGNTSTARESEETVAAGRRPPAAATESRRGRAARRSEPKGSGADLAASGGTAGKPDEETRNVGGRVFRRQGGVWVDRAYTAGRAVVHVTRGSEQYRALVSDEPSLRAIADQLGGEVIVVWKGRAYRIR